MCVCKGHSEVFRGRLGGPGEEEEDGLVDHGSDRGGGEKKMDLESILEVEFLGFVGGMKVRRE